MNHEVHMAKLKAENALDCIDSMGVICQYVQKDWETKKEEALESLNAAIEILQELSWAPSKRYTPPSDRPLKPHYCQKLAACLKPNNHEGDC